MYVFTEFLQLYEYQSARHKKYVESFLKNIEKVQNFKVYIALVGRYTITICITRKSKMGKLAPALSNFNISTHTSTKQGSHPNMQQPLDHYIKQNHNLVIANLTTDDDPTLSKPTFIFYYRRRKPIIIQPMELS